MPPPVEATPIRRSDWRSAMAWISARRSRTVFVVGLLLAAGSFSALGLLRWQVPFPRWSFALLCWGMAAVVSLRSLGRERRSVLTLPHGKRDSEREWP